jgi:hypothetical protein
MIVGFMDMPVDDETTGFNLLARGSPARVIDAFIVRRAPLCRRSQPAVVPITPLG